MKTQFSKKFTERYCQEMMKEDAIRQGKSKAFVELQKKVEKTFGRILRRIMIPSSN